jgi:molecular chaperone GrpE
MVEQYKIRRPNGETDGAAAADQQTVPKQEALPGEAEGAEAVTVSADEQVKALQKALEAADNRAQDYYQQLLRLRADYENLKKRVNKEREEFQHFAGEALVASLLPVLDDFERALKSPGEKVGDFLSGIEMVYRQLNDTFANEGLEVIPAVGGPFDPTRHEAVAFEADEEQPPNTILEEFRRGYTFRGKVLRPALVKVAREKEM